MKIAYAALRHIEMTPSGSGQFVDNPGGSG
jgi:hypothetical protein